MSDMDCSPKQTEKCPTCDGRRTLVGVIGDYDDADPCPDCNGTGVLRP